METIDGAGTDSFEPEFLFTLYDCVCESREIAKGELAMCMSCACGMHAHVHVHVRVHLCVRVHVHVHVHHRRGGLLVGRGEHAECVHCLQLASCTAGLGECSPAQRRANLGVGEVLQGERVAKVNPKGVRGVVTYNDPPALRCA